MSELPAVDTSLTGQSREMIRELVMRALPPERRFDDQNDFARSDPGINSGTFFSILSRRRGMIIGCVVLVTLLAVATAYLLPPLYVAEALVILDTRRAEIVQQPAVLSNLVSGSLADAAIVRSEVTLISSPAYARKVIERLDLLHNPVFDRELNPEEGKYGLATATNLISDVRDYFEGPNDTVNTATPIGRAIALLSRNLTVYNDDRSYAIRLRYSSTDPNLATSIVNTLAQSYIADQLDAKREATNRAGVWIKDQLAALLAKLRDNESKIAKFEQQHHLTTVITGSVTEQRLQELNTQLMAATGDRAQKQATLEEIQEMMKAPGGALAASQVLSWPLIQRLREQEATAAGKVASFREEFRSNVSAPGQALVKEIDDRIAAEVQRIALGLKGEVAAAQVREDALRDAIQRQEAKMDAATTARVQLADLQREESVGRNLYDSFLLRSQQVEADGQSLQSGARAVSAEIPIRPSFPNKPLFIGFGFFGSLFLGVMLAFAVERADDKVRTADDAERLTGLRTFGVVPRMRNGTQAMNAIVDAPLSAFSDAISTTLLGLRMGSGGHLVVAVSSSLPGEGKTLFAAALARCAATSRARTLLIDCDMRRGTVGRVFGKPDASAVAAMFEEKSVELSKFVQTDESSGLHYLPTARLTFNPQELLGSTWMLDLIAQAQAEYDLVVLDTPPLLMVSDGLLLSRMADTTLLLVRSGKTPSGVVAEAARMLNAYARGSVNTVLSQVHMRKYMRYRDPGYYSSKVQTGRLARKYA
jgi:succinoglycan biosynthesis transport protein ExoP